MSLKIVLTGSHGMVGKVIQESFIRDGDQVYQVIRSQNQQPQVRDANSIIWNIQKQTIDSDSLEGANVVIHLAGASIADNRWTPSYKKEIYNSRILSTRLLSQSLAKLKNKPKVFISASAIGFYGNHEPSKLIDEDSPNGNGFLADVCEDWEKETFVASQSGIRVVQLRFGVILGSKGALGKMLPIFKLGLGGPLGHGRQMMSWISVNEIPKIIRYIIEKENLSGAINCVAPDAVSNREFTNSLGQVLKRPTFFSAPAFMIRLLLGEMGQELLLEGVNVKPKKLIQSGYSFQYPELRGTLEYILKLD